MSLTLHYDCLNNTIIKGPVPICARAGSRWRFNSSGLLVAVPINTIAHDHDVNGNPLGWLVEGTRENIALHNRDASDAVWSGGVNMAVAKDAIGLDGVANSASTLTGSAANARHSQPITVASAERTFSIWLRRKTGSGTILVTDDGFVSTVDVTSAINSSTYTKVGEITTTQANPDIGVEIVTSGDEVEMDIGQIEAGNQSSSPILTAAASVTRNKDGLVAALGSLWNEAGDSIYLEFSRTGITNGSYNYLDFTDGGAGADRITIFPSGTPANRVKYTTVSSGGAAGDVSLATGISTPAADTTYKVAAGLADSNAELFVEGVRIGTGDQTVDVPTGIDTLHIGQNFLGGGPVFVHFRAIRIYNEHLGLQGLEDLSNGIFPPSGFDIMGFMRRRRGR